MITLINITQNRTENHGLRPRYKLLIPTSSKYKIEGGNALANKLVYIQINMQQLP